MAAARARQLAPAGPHAGRPGVALGRKSESRGEGNAFASYSISNFNVWLADVPAGGPSAGGAGATTQGAPVGENSVGTITGAVPPPPYVLGCGPALRNA